LILDLDSNTYENFSKTEAICGRTEGQEVLSPLSSTAVKQHVYLLLLAKCMVRHYHGSQG